MSSTGRRSAKEVLLLSIVVPVLLFGSEKKTGQTINESRCTDTTLHEHVDEQQAFSPWIDGKWTWLDGRRCRRTRAELDAIVNAHELWLRSGGTRGDRANFSSAILTEASFVDVDFTDAIFSDASLAKGNFDGTNLAEVVYEVKINPDPRDLSTAVNLELLRYRYSPDAIAQLRKTFRDDGLELQARKLTYALRRTASAIKWSSMVWSLYSCRVTRWLPWLPPYKKISASSIGVIVEEDGPWTPYKNADDEMCNYGRVVGDTVEYVFDRLAFDFTCQYGLSPNRPLGLLCRLLIVMGLIYWIVAHISGGAGFHRRVKLLWAGKEVWVQRRVRFKQPHSRRRWRKLILVGKHEMYLLRDAMLFSLGSTFNIGYKELNIGQWVKSLLSG